MNSKYQRLIDEAAAAAKAARAITEKVDAERRSHLTAAEQVEFEALYKRAVELKKQADTAKADEVVMAQAKELTDLVGLPSNSGPPWSPAGHAGGPSWATSPNGGSAWAKETAARLGKSMTTTDGQKAIVSGSVGVPNVIDPNIARIGQVPRTILDLIGVRPAPSDGLGGNTFTFLRQTVRTNNAAPVADGALKPTSVYTVAEIEERFRVVAHLSEALPQRFFADHAQLEDFLATEMQYGLERAVEAQVLTGTGTGENFTGILNTSGIQAVAFVTDVLTTARKAITAMQVTGNTPTAFVMNPADLEAFDLLKAAGSGVFLLGGPGTKADETLWSIPRVPSTALTAGTAVLADWRQAELVVREDANLATDTSGANFTNNLVTMRVEGRFGLAVKRPNAFARVALV